MTEYDDAKDKAILLKEWINELSKFTKREEVFHAKKLLEKIIPTINELKVLIDKCCSPLGMATFSQKVLEKVREGSLSDDDMIPEEQIINSFPDEGRAEVMKILDELINKGEVYRPRHHFVKLVRKVRK